MDTRKILIAMREILTPEGAWTQNECMRDEWGNGALYLDKASSYCLYGAAQAARGTFRIPDSLCDFLNDRSPDIFGFIAWNDAKGRTQAEVLAFLDECIAELDPLRLDYEFEWDIPARDRELEDA